MSSKELFKLNPIKFCLAMGLQIIAAVGEVVVAYVLTLQFDAAKNRNLSLFLTWTLIQLSSYVMVFLFYNLAKVDSKLPAFNSARTNRSLFCR